MVNKEHSRNIKRISARAQETIMLKQIIAVLSRPSSTIWQDLAGGIALMVLLYGGLALPGTI